MNRGFTVGHGNLTRADWVSTRHGRGAGFRPAQDAPTLLPPGECPVLAVALALGCPIWTEDTDFFGCRVATWTSGRIAIFLAQ